MEGTVMIPASDYSTLFAARMALIDDMLVAQAIARGLAFRCPVCRIIHPGIFYEREDYRKYCGTACWRRRFENG
jgi:hypothetical protein